MAKMTPDQYEAKRQEKIARLENAAARARSEGKARVDRAHEMASVIPFGQPILVGHHSETRDRNYRGKIENNFRKGFEQMDHAKELEARAAAVASNDAIFSDDPQAVEKLEDKIARLEKRQELMTAANKLIRKNDRAGLLALGFSEESIEKLYHPIMGRPGYQTFELTNNGANIRRLKARAETLKAHENDQESETIVNDIRIVDNPDANRLQVFFPGKPDETTRSALKSYGFRWTPSVGCWQSYRSRHAYDAAYKIATSQG
jgi:hypothetical protein